MATGNSSILEQVPLQVNNTTTTTTAANTIKDHGKDNRLFLDMITYQMIGLIIASALMVIFFLGLAGAYMESVLCLRIFGAILSYLFLLTFGACLYLIILMVISNVAIKLILSMLSVCAVTITMHAALAIAPFAFADLLSQVSGALNSYLY